MSKSWNPAKTTLGDGDGGTSLEELSLDTRSTSARYSGPNADPLVPAIHHSATYRLKGVDDFLKIIDTSGYIYARLGHPNSEAVECAINALEGGAGTMVFTAGVGAITAAFMCFLKAGDHVVCQNPVYSGTYGLLDKILRKFGVETTWVTAGSPMEEYRKHVKPNTRLLYGETPCNPNMTILDLEAFGKLGESLGDEVITMVDGTFASPYFQQSMKYGIDISMHSWVDMKVLGCLLVVCLLMALVTSQYNGRLAGLVSLDDNIATNERNQRDERSVDERLVRDRFRRQVGGGGKGPTGGKRRLRNRRFGSSDIS